MKILKITGLTCDDFNDGNEDFINKDVLPLLSADMQKTLIDQIDEATRIIRDDLAQADNQRNRFKTPEYP